MSLLNKMIVLAMPVIPKPIVRLVSKRYIAGDSLPDALRTVKQLHAQGIVATIDVLGESAERAEESSAAVEEYFRVLDAIDKERLDCNVSVKPTQLGMLIDKDLCYENIKKIVQKASAYKNFVRIDMEDSSVTTDTIDLFLKLRKEYDQVGIVIQAYLRRSIDDINRLAPLKTNFRLCKGIYVEPREIAYKHPDIIVKNFAFLVEKTLRAGCYIGIATHDEKVVWESLRIIDRLGCKREAFEFQMLLGVDEQLRKILVDAGYKLRVYVPYGQQWYAYSMRRLKENPKVALYIIKAFFGIK
jgi:proline dehydrogenase